MMRWQRLLNAHRSDTEPTAIGDYYNNNQAMKLLLVPKTGGSAKDKADKQGSATKKPVEPELLVGDTHNNLCKGLTKYNIL
jgi:hypothetical protein